MSTKSHTTPSSYDDWAETLSSFFFDPAHDGEEILFAADELSLAEASGLDPDESTEALGRAVREVIGYHWAVENVYRRVRAFRSGSEVGDQHPALPFLALTVLAASQMGAHGSVASHNYYVPLRRLIDPNDEEHGSPGTFTDYINLLWRDLETWSNVDLQGQRGTLKIRPTGHLTYVGLALQHALVRSSDLRRLDDFFRRIGLAPGEDVSASELRRGLAVWVGLRHESWARRLSRLATDDDLAEYCEALLDRTAQNWDGRPRDARTGRPVGRLRLGTTSLRRLELGVYAEWDDRLPEAARLHIGDSDLELTQWHNWYKPLPLPVSAELAMEEGLDLPTSGFTFSLSDADAYALGFDDDLGGWVSVDRMSFGNTYSILTKDSEPAASSSFLRGASAVEVRTRSNVGGIPHGWSLIESVRIDTQPAGTPPDSLASLIPTGNAPRLRLLGGLPVSSERNVYLRGGEPVLALSSLNDQNEFQVANVETGDWKAYIVDESQNREAPLWDLELEPGDYEITHGDVSIHIRIVDGIVETAGPGVGTINHAARDGAKISGVTTDFPTSGQRPITVRAPVGGQRAYLIDEIGDTYEVEVPRWLRGPLGYDPDWRDIDAWPPFAPSWQIMTDATGCLAMPLQPRPPGRFEVDASTRWAELIQRASLYENQSPDVVAIWSEYKALAGRGNE